MQTIVISKSSAIKSIRRGHPWVFSGAVESLTGSDGEIVRMTDAGNNFLAVGYLCKGASIRVRVLSFDDVEINQEFWNEKFISAYSFRESTIDQKSTNCFRLINAEGDYIPGLIVDAYDNYAVIDYHVEGLAVFDEEIRAATLNLGFTPINYDSSPGSIEVRENSLKFQASPGKGQKTGFFIDQRENRKRIQKYCKGKSVLNVFSYTGGFSVYAHMAGAKSVVNVDSSEFAIEQAKENYKLNGLDVHDEDFVISDAFKYLEKLVEKENRFDVVILDPPAFVKRKDAIRRALSGYRRINYLGMRLTSPGGVLTTYSCSGHITNDQLRTIVWQSANDAMRGVQILENPRNQLDHPISVNCPECEYLKGLFLRVN